MAADGLGPTLLSARLRAGLTQRQLAAAVGVSHVFIGEVERGIRRLPVSRWAAAVAAMDGAVTLKALAEAAVAEGHVTLDTEGMTTEERAVVAGVLVKMARRGGGG